MPENTIVAHRKLPCARALRRFRDDPRGTSAVEFALLAAPFLIFLLLIFEVATVFLAGQAVENATQDSARLIRTGQAGQFTPETFKASVCGRLWMLPNCETRLKLDARIVPNFASVDLSVPIVDGELDDSQFGFDGGSGNDIVVLRAFYEWGMTPALPRLIQLLGLRPALEGTGSYLLLSTAVFRNEPFTS